MDRAICVPVSRNEIPGISKHKRDGTWGVRITLQGKRVHIGTYRTFAEAAEAYRSATGSVS
jgi:hypothetical protein